MDDDEFLVDPGVNFANIDEDSGSAYEETSSDGEQDYSHDERDQVSRPSSATPRRERRERGRSRGRKPLRGSKESTTSPPRQSVNPHAKHQAAVDDVESTRRSSAESRSKRKAERPTSQARAKRMKTFYNNDYRELLNSTIREAASRFIPDEDSSLLQSQIGSSIWTGEEKEIFFSALSRLGRHDSPGIALQLGTKSALEVHEYITLLYQSLKDRENLRLPRLDYTHLPAAFEISEECEDLLETAGDSLAFRQEISEESAEKDKHGELWLLTSDICTLLDNKREDPDEQSTASPLPAANLFDLKTWLELSQNIFMNSGSLHEDDNWQAIAGPEEMPAIRATAFEDFHTLAVSITRRLMSAVLFCAMSRRRATRAAGAKHAEILPDDVDAAINILGLPENSLEFWIGSARRHSLHVVDDDGGSEGDIELTYDEVEASLRQTRRRSRSRSRSRSMSRQSPSRQSVTSSVGGRSNRDTAPGSTTDNLSTDEDSVYDEELGDLSSPSADDDLMELSEAQIETANARVQEMRRKKAEDVKKAQKAQDAYLEAYDNEASRIEEQRLRNLLRQSSPLEIKLEPVDLPDAPPQGRHGASALDWKDNFEYWSPWETLQTPVAEESFAINRKKTSKQARRHARERSRSGEVSNEHEKNDVLDDVSQEEMVVASPEGEEDDRVDATDMQMKGNEAEDLYSASLEERESPQPRSQENDEAFTHGTLDFRRRAQSEEDIAIGEGYDD